MGSRENAGQPISVWTNTRTLVIKTKFTLPKFYLEHQVKCYHYNTRSFGKTMEKPFSAHTLAKANCNVVALPHECFTTATCHKKENRPLIDLSLNIQKGAVSEKVFSIFPFGRLANAKIKQIFVTRKKIISLPQ